MSLILFFYVTVTSKNTKKINISGYSATAFNDNWYYYDHNRKQTVSLPTRVPIPTGNSPIAYRIGESKSEPAQQRGRTTRLYRMLPEILPEGACIGFYSLHQNAILSAGGRILYTYQIRSGPEWLHSYRKLFHIAPVPEDVAGTELCLTLTATIPVRTGQYSSVLIGSRSSILNSFRKQHTPMYFFSQLLIVEGVFLFLIQLLFSKEIRHNMTLLYFSLVCLLTGLWEYASSMMPQLVLESPAVLWGFEYLSAMLLPPTIVKFLISARRSQQKVNQNEVRILSTLFTLSVIGVCIQLILQISGIRQFEETMLISNLILAVIGLYATWLLIQNLMHNDKNVFLLSGLVALVLGLTFQESTYYTTNFSSDLTTTITFILFFVLEFFYLHRFIVDKIDEIRQAVTYQKLALIDFSTGVSSRTAWYTFVEKYVPDATIGKKYCIILFDMNNLKKINDTYGHLVGDTVIKSFSECLKQTFGSIGTIYRVGGDEFVCLCCNIDATMLATAISAFNKMVMEQNCSPYPFTAAYGYKFFIPENKNDFYKAQGEADTNMYLMKFEMKTNPH